MGEPGGLLSMGSHRIGHDLAAARRKWEERNLRMRMKECMSFTTLYLFFFFGHTMDGLQNLSSPTRNLTQTAGSEHV